MATWNGTITASSDDAREDSGSMVLTGANFTIQATYHYAGLRFLNVTIPQGDTINSATVTVEITSAAYDDPDVDIYAEDTDDAATFTTSASDISGRTPTTAVVQWTAGSIGGGVQVSPDIAAVIQEIVSRPGWASGNDIVIIFKGRSTNPFRFYAYDNGAGTYATLDVTYTAGSSGLTKQAQYYARMRS